MCTVWIGPKTIAKAKVFIKGFKKKRPDMQMKQNVFLSACVNMVLESYSDDDILEIIKQFGENSTRKTIKTWKQIEKEIK